MLQLLLCIQSSVAQSSAACDQYHWHVYYCSSHTSMLLYPAKKDSLLQYAWCTQGFIRGLLLMHHTPGVWDTHHALTLPRPAEHWCDAFMEMSYTSRDLASLVGAELDTKLQYNCTYCSQDCSYKPRH